MAVPTSTDLPKDKDSVPIQVLSPSEVGTVNFVLATTTNPQALPAGSQIVEVAVSGNALIKFGVTGVNATSGGHLIVTGVYIYRVPIISGALADHMDAVTVDGSTGRCTITRLV